MTSSLEKIWISKPPGVDTDGATFESDAEDPEYQEERDQSNASSLSLGDTHIWRDNGDANV
jgi:hypothetical protein